MKELKEDTNEKTSITGLKIENSFHHLIICMNGTGKAAAKLKHYNIFTVYPYSQYIQHNIYHSKIYATKNMLINP